MKKQILLSAAIGMCCLQSNGQGFIGAETSSYLDFRIHNTNYHRFNSNGNLLINSTSDDGNTAPLQVFGQADIVNNNLNFNQTSSGSGNLITSNGSTNVSVAIPGIPINNWYFKNQGMLGSDYAGYNFENVSAGSGGQGVGLFPNQIRFTFGPSGTSGYIPAVTRDYSTTPNYTLVFGSNYTPGTIPIDTRIVASPGTSSNGADVYIDGGLKGTGAFRNGYVLIGSIDTTRVGINTGSPSYTLDINGTANCTSSSWVSDLRFKKNISDLSNVKEALLGLLSHSYNFRRGEFKDYRFDDNLHYGFIAQEVEKVYPNLVNKNDKGYYAVNYIEFIPLLLQALKEEDVRINELESKVAVGTGGQSSDAQNTKLSQLESKLATKDAELAALQARLNSLENNLNACCNANANKGGVSDAGNANVKSTLAQNVPNPTKGETVIGYNIVGSYSKAFIGIYDLNGREVKKIALQQGSSEVTINKGVLMNGQYVYSLIVDNNLIDSKKMIVME